MLYSSSLAYANENWYRGEEGELGLVYSSAVEYSGAYSYKGVQGVPVGGGLIYSSDVEYSSTYDYLGLELHPGASLTYYEVGMLTDIWRRFGLDIDNPLIQGESILTFGPTISLSGSDEITSTRSGATTQGAPVSTMLTEVWQRLGLDSANPMEASATQITAGAIVQTISESSGTVTVHRA